MSLDFNPLLNFIFMKKSENTAAKKARKAFKRELTVKIGEQLKATIGNIGADTKKTGKAIEKAAKNLAKKLSKQADIKTAPAPAAKVKPVAKETPAVKAEPATAKPVKAKPATAKKPAAATE